MFVVFGFELPKELESILIKYQDKDVQYNYIFDALVHVDYWFYSKFPGSIADNQFREEYWDVKRVKSYVESWLYELCAKKIAERNRILERRN